MKNQDINNCNNNNNDKTIKTNIGEIPLQDYFEICAISNGFESYEDMKQQGYFIDINTI